MREKIFFFGAGRVGSSTAIVLANKNPNLDFYVYDIDKEKIDFFNNGVVPFFEPQLKNRLNNVLNKNIFFVPEIERDTIKKSLLVFVCVPFFEEKKENFVSVINQIKNIKANANIVIRSTLTPKIIEDEFIILNPEFLAEGSCVQDLETPHKIVIATQNKEGVEALEKLYWFAKDKIIETKTFEAEILKIASNAFLLLRVAAINTLTSALEQSSEANIKIVEELLKRDKRIGSEYLSSGFGAGGPCLIKDLKMLIYFFKKNSMINEYHFWRTVLNSNYQHIERIVNKIEKISTNKKVCFNGVFFKEFSDSTTDSPLLIIHNRLKERGFELRIFDTFSGTSSLADSAEGCSLLITLGEIKSDLKKIKEKMFDASILTVAQVDKKNFEKEGFRVFQIGVG